MASRRMLGVLSTVVVLPFAWACGCSNSAKGPQITAIRLTPIDSTIAPYSSQKYLVWATYSDGSRGDATVAARLGSSNPSVASVEANARAQAAGVGTTRITAAVGDIQDSTNLTVAVGAPTLLRVSIEWGLPVFGAGVVIGQYYRAIGHFEDGSTQELTTKGQWNSSNPQVMVIDDSGRATYTGSGTSVLSFTYGAITKSVNFQG